MKASRPVDPARTLLVERAKELGWTMASLSREAGRNHSYVQQFVDGRVAKLGEAERRKIARLLGVKETLLRTTPTRKPAQENPKGPAKMPEITLETIHSELSAMRADMRAELAPIRAGVNGIPILNRSITVLQQDMRALRAAFNDFALTNITKGEIEALHHDVNAVQARNAELEIEIATLRRRIEELEEK